MYFQYKYCKVKSISNFKSTLLNAILISTTLFSVSSCTETSKPQENKTMDTKKASDDVNMAKPSNTATDHDAQFLMKAADINLTEISLGGLVRNNSQMPEVKKLGETIIQDHTKSMKDLTALAKQKNVTLPDSLSANSKMDYKNLSAKKGMAFDKAYSDMMVQGHKDAIKIFETASSECVDVDIRAFALATLPDLRMHLDHATMCQKDNEKMK